MATATAAFDYNRPWIYPEQEAAIFCPERYSFIEASTKSGKTVGCLVWLFEQAIQGSTGRNYWWVAPSYRQAKIAYRRMKNGLPREVYRANDSDLSLTIPNGTTIWFLTGEKPDNLYGEDVYAVVMDEASRMREEAWHAVRSTLTATRGPIRVIGNVKGKQNWFYRMARNAEAGQDGMHYAKITYQMAVQAGVLEQDEISDAQSVLPERVFGELYNAEPSDDGGNPFGIDHIRACIGPMSDADPVVWGWDLAKKMDWTVGTGLDSRGHVCRFERFQRPWKETIEYILEESLVKSNVDSTGVGDPIVEELQRRGGSRFIGFNFTSTSKQKIMEGLAVGIQQGNVTFPEGILTGELESFEYEYTRTGVRYSAPEGLHDDAVCSLALAWSIFKAPSGNIKEVKSVPSKIGRRGGDW